MIVAKELGNPFELLSIRLGGKEKDFSDVLSGTQRAMLGHCRSKTTGEVTRKNAHPFLVDGIMGTHNGTLSYQTLQKLEGKDKFGTDSEALFYQIRHHGIDETIKMMRRDERPEWSNPDAYALVWYDSRDNTLNFLRNNERPLWYCYSKDRQRIIWSSEKGHLFAATDKTIPHEDSYLTELPVDMHYSWVIPKQGEQFQKPRGVRREGTVDPLVVYRGTSIIPARHKQNSGQNGSTVINSTDGKIVFFDNLIGFFRMFNKAKYRYEFAQFSGGPYYDDLQQLWDTLSEQQQARRLKMNRYPTGINLKKKLGDGVYTLIKQGRDNSDTNETLAEEADKIVGFLPRKNEGEYCPWDQGEAAEARAKALREEQKNRERVVRTSLKDSARSKLFDQCFPDEDFSKLQLVHQDDKNRVYWDRTGRRYRAYTFCGFTADPKKSWMRFDQEVCPQWVPFEVHDINARHWYKHQKVGKNKVISYKGFKGDLLVRASFNKLMEGGCIQCLRRPEFENYVRFVDHKHFFCAHCSRDSILVEEFARTVKEKKTIN